MMARCLLALLMHKTSADVHWRDLAVRRPDGAFLLEPCSGTAAAGTFTAVLGASGAGKSTLLRALVRARRRGARARRATCEPAAARSAACDGDRGLLAQDSELFAMLTVRETLEFAHALRGASRAEAAALAERGLRTPSASRPSSRVWRSYVDGVVLLAPGGRVAYAGPRDARARARATGAAAAAFREPGGVAPRARRRRGLRGAALRRRGAGAAAARGAGGRRGARPAPRRAAWRARLAARAAGRARDARVQALRLASTGGLGAFLARRYGGGAPALSASGARTRRALLSFSAISMCVLRDALDLFGKERKVVAREVERGAYGGGEYVLAKALAEVPSGALRPLHGWALGGAAHGRGVRSAPRRRWRSPRRRRRPWASRSARRRRRATPRSRRACRSSSSTCSRAS
ncbi:ABC transporter [Aureococcus anophagefferens]|uniref:ABC transporter n=1 Tax=Aureococcus anophagefferens TaxID=44056 RepID=A0ABR1GC80_AURAN